MMGKRMIGTPKGKISKGLETIVDRASGDGK
jgi:hypothetical protein